MNIRNAINPQSIKKILKFFIQSALVERSKKVSPAIKKTTKIININQKCKTISLKLFYTNEQKILHIYVNEEENNLLPWNAKKIISK